MLSAAAALHSDGGDGAEGDQSEVPSPVPPTTADLVEEFVAEAGAVVNRFLKWVVENLASGAVVQPMVAQMEDGARRASYNSRISDWIRTTLDHPRVIKAVVSHGGTFTSSSHRG